MFEILTVIGLGFISSVLAALFALSIQAVWQKIAIPWFEERFYHDARIEGRWTGILEYPDQSTEDVIVDIKRHSYNIHRTMTIKSNGNTFGIWATFII